MGGDAVVQWLMELDGGEEVKSVVDDVDDDNLDLISMASDVGDGGGEDEATSTREVQRWRDWTARVMSKEEKDVVVLEGSDDESLLLSRVQQGRRSDPTGEVIGGDGE